jgi:FlaA1/EpsC-like NDP-sugar epimerase
VARAAERSGVELFVLISTDKAVNPVSVMGATKRVCELMIRAMNHFSPTTRFLSVRFGNVLGSNGSVVPLFLNQIKSGGPVTVTHPERRRFFMLISEAVQLVLHAAAIGNGGELYVLDMGEQINVLEMAHNLIRLSGFVPEDEIPIIFTGLRPGEKLHEELIAPDEVIVSSGVEKILEVRTQAIVEERLFRQIAELETPVRLGDDSRVVSFLTRLIPEFRTSSLPHDPPRELQQDHVSGNGTIDGPNGRAAVERQAISTSPISKTPSA